MTTEKIDLVIYERRFYTLVKNIMRNIHLKQQEIKHNSGNQEPKL